MLISAVVFHLLVCYQRVVIAAGAVCVTPVMLLKAGPAPQRMQVGGGARGDGTGGSPGGVAQPLRGSGYSLPGLQDVNYRFSFLGLFGLF